MFEFIQANIVANMYLLIAVYYVPLFGCLIGYTIRTWKNLQRDKRECNMHYYSPKVTYGVLLGYLIVSIMPVANALWFVFDIFGDLCKLIGQVFDKPLISHKYEKEDK